MSRDREAVVWSRLATRPMRMGRLYLTDSECRFSYDPEYLQSGLPGLGVIYDPALYQHNTIVRPRTEFFDFLPPIQTLVPPRGEKNFQRRLVLNYLASKGITPASGLEADWEILKVSGHGAIGHLDLFESDDKALEWYSEPDKNELFTISDDLGFSLKEFLTWFDHDAGALLQAIGPTPSVGGAIPKLLLSIPASGWDGRIGLPSRVGGHERTDVVLKFEQSNTYPGIIELEALALEIHRAAGFEVPRHWSAEIDGIPILAVERFDRDQHHNPLFTESLYSVLASGDSRITHNYSYSYDQVGRAIDRSPIHLVSDRDAAKQHLMKRFILSLLTGNGDLHLENLSIINRGGELMFSPVYDPTPMRAWSIHNMLSVMPFGNYGEPDDHSGSPTGVNAALRNLAKNLGLGKTALAEIMHTSLAATENYSQQVSALTSLPQQNRQNLIAITEKLRATLRTLTG